eukprot:TRINITY_DN35997_c0_g1_i1.p1 TRINITY_DN35997_c0_g1~~TRINITY_DN35997_c0_g1_i1.p1  ORF type:complete len:313 (-),score=120.46 TRINITY_DN35997_c0_g1_i1:193-1131(-)
MEYSERPYERQLGECLRAVLLQDSSEVRALCGGCDCIKHESETMSKDQKAEALKELFCSELVAAIYQEMGWMDDLYIPSRYMPKDFSSAPNSNLDGRLVGCTLAPEAQVVLADYQQIDKLVEEAKQSQRRAEELKEKAQKEKRDVEQAEKKLSLQRQTSRQEFEHYEAELREANEAEAELEAAKATLQRSCCSELYTSEGGDLGEAKIAVEDIEAAKARVAELDRIAAKERAEADEAKATHEQAHEERLAAEAIWLKELEEFQQVDHELEEAENLSKSLAETAAGARAEKTRREMELKEEADREKEEEVAGL